MKSPKKWQALLGLLMIASLLLVACAPSTPATPETIIQTVVVTQMVEGEPVEVVVTPTPSPDTGDSDAGFLAADGLGACLPLPEMEISVVGSGPLASRVPVSQSARPPAVEYRGSASETLQAGDNIYRIGVFEDVTSLNFFAANGPDNTVWNSYMLPQRLTLYGLSDKYFTLVPNVAVPLTPDPLEQEGDFWVTSIPIRQDITWSDGTPFTANDVAFSLNAPLEIGLISGNWTQWVDGNYLDHAEAVDDYTVKLYYHTRPGMARHEYGTLQAPILSADYWSPVFDEAAAPVRALAAEASAEDVAAAQAEAVNILFAHSPDGEPTAGAFTLSRWEQGAFLDSNAYTDYYINGLTIRQWENGAYEDSESLAVGTPEGEETVIDVGPNVGAVVYTIYGSQDAAILALKNGEVDFVLNSLGLQRGLANQLRNDPNLTVLENPQNGFRYLSFNNRRRPMNDCSFRQAVSVLIDKEFVTGTILQGAAFPLYTYVAPANVNWYTDDVPKLGQSLNRQQRLEYAMAILEQAGYNWENDVKPSFDTTGNSVIPGGRLIMPDGTPVPELELWAPSAGYDPLRSTFAIWIETWLNEVGIPVKAELAGFNVLIPRIFTNQDFDMYILGWSLNIFPSGLRDFFSEEQSAPGGNNAGGYISEEFERLSTELLTCPNYETCKPIAEEIQNFLATESPYVVLFDTGIIEAYRSDVLEYPYTEQLSGLQYTHQGGLLQSSTKIR